jgi:NAD-dependent dihydropyrimidine dehydrogenase PreA subunit
MSEPAEPAPDPSCKGPGVVTPIIDRERCEGKEDCVRVCPYGVFAVGTLDAEARRQLSRLGRVRAFFHGYRQAMIAQPDRCHACGACVAACPERAIKLAATSSSRP